MKISRLSLSRGAKLPLEQCWDNVGQGQSDDFETHNVSPGLAVSGDMKSMCYSGSTVMADEDDWRLVKRNVILVIYYIPKCFDNQKSNVVLVVPVCWSATAVARQVRDKKRLVREQRDYRAPPKDILSV